MHGNSVVLPIKRTKWCEKLGFSAQNILYRDYVIAKLLYGIFNKYLLRHFNVNIAIVLIYFQTCKTTTYLLKILLPSKSILKCFALIRKEYAFILNQKYFKIVVFPRMHLDFKYDSEHKARWKMKHIINYFKVVFYLERLCWVLTFALYEYNLHWRTSKKIYLFRMLLY